MPNPYQSDESNSGYGVSEKSGISLTICNPAPADDDTSSGTGYESEHVLPLPPRQWAALPPSGFGLQPAASCTSGPAAPPQPEQGSSLPRPGRTNQSAAVQAPENSNFRAAFLNLCQQIEELHYGEMHALIEENTRLHADLHRQGGKKFKTSDAMHGIRSQDSKMFAAKGSLNSKSSGSWMMAQSGSSGSKYGMINKRTQSRLFGEDRVPGGNFGLREEWNIDDAELFRIATKGAVGTADQNLNFDKRNSAGTGSYTASLFSDRRVPLHPEHSFRLAWDVMAATLLAYDTVMLPLYLFEIRSRGATRILDWLTAVFWTFDIPASLCTGVFIKGRLEMSFQRVCKQYSKTWMLPDVTMVLVEWTLLFLDIDGNGSGVLSSVGAVRNMRVLRFVRLVRLIKLERLIFQLTRRINSVYLLLSLRIIRMVLAILVANHILASSWYAIGIKGWVQKQEMDKSNVLYCYLTAFHWSLTQFHGSMEISPKSLNERLFAVLVLLTALVAFSWFLSSMTNSMIMLQNIHQERTAQQRCLLGFLSQRHVSQALAVRIKEYITMYHKENPAIIQTKEVALLHVLPKGLMTDLHAEVRGGMVLGHPLFYHINELYPHFIRQLMNEAVEEVYASRKDLVFCTGEACSRMLFVNSEMSYTPGHLRVQTLSTLEREELVRSVSSCSRSVSMALSDGNVIVEHRTWLSEPVLWTHWVNCGSLTALEDAYLYALQVENFLRHVMLYEEVRLDATVYAKAYIELLNASQPSDLPDRVDAHQVWKEVNVHEEKKCSVGSAERARLPSKMLGKGFRRTASALSLGSIRHSLRSNNSSVNQSHSPRKFGMRWP